MGWRWSLLILLVVGCTKTHHEAEAPLEIYRVEDLPQDFRVPSRVWDETLPKDPILKPKPILYGPVQIKLVEKNKGTLKEKSAIYEFPSGGGELDLSKVISHQPGSFFMSFHVPILEKAINKKAFYISQGRQRKVDGEVFGSGCHQLLEMSSSIGKLDFAEVLTLNTTRDRHVSILAGHFIFLVETESSWIVSQLSFYDSKRKDLICPEAAKQVSAL